MNHIFGNLHKSLWYAPCEKIKWNFCICNSIRVILMFFAEKKTHQNPIYGVYFLCRITLHLICLAHSVAVMYSREVRISSNLRWKMTFSPETWSIFSQEQMHTYRNSSAILATYFFMENVFCWFWITVNYSQKYWRELNLGNVYVGRVKRGFKLKWCICFFIIIKTSLWKVQWLWWSWN